MRRFRTHPRAPRYQALSEAQYVQLEEAVWAWLDESGTPIGDPRDIAAPGPGR